MARQPSEKRAYVRYSARLAETIIDAISTGRSLDEVCAGPGMPDRHTIRRWCIERPEFAERYETARHWSAYSLLDEIADLVDRGQEIVETAAKNGGNANAAASVLREQLNVKRWMVGKLLPQFADKVTTELTGAGGAPLLPERELPLDTSKIALSLLAILHAAPGGRNHPDTSPAPLLAMPTATLLSGQPDPEPESPMGDEAALREIFDGVRVDGEPAEPVFVNGRVVRLAPKGSY